MAARYESPIPLLDDGDMLLIEKVQQDERLFREVVTREVLSHRRYCSIRTQCFDLRISSLEKWRTIIAGGMIVAGILTPIIGFLLVNYAWK